MRPSLSSGHSDEQKLYFYLFLEEIISPNREHDVRQMIAEVEATSWRLRECIRVRELATARRLGRMRRLRMLKEQKAWKREAGFDRIDIAAEMDEQRFRTGLDSEHINTKLYNPRWPHTPEEQARNGCRRREIDNENSTSAARDTVAM